MLKGISLCKGIAMAEAFIYKKETLVIPQKKMSSTRGRTRKT